MGRSKRAKAAAKAAKRIPIVGATVTLLPMVEAVAETGISSGNVMDPATWQRLGKNVLRRYTGWNGDSKAFEVQSALGTYLPIAAYTIVKRTRLSAPISRVLGKIGLRF